MKLSIIIPVHNEEKYIEQTIEKVWAMTMQHEKEIIVTNDGSTDNTPKILKTFKKKNKKRIKKSEWKLVNNSRCRLGI